MLKLLFLALYLCSAKLLKPSTPTRGWNSYDSFGCGECNETIVLMSAQAVHDKLLPFGYNYVTIDAGWFGADATSRIDEYGRWIPDDSLYPSLKGNFKELADQVHLLGLKFGVWIMYGIPQTAVAANTPIKGTNYTAKDISLGPSTACPWASSLTYDINLTHPAGVAYYQSNVELWEQWGLDFLKLDCVFAQNETPYTKDDIIAISNALNDSGREFVLSLSPGGNANATALHDIAIYATQARITEDLWDDWSNVSAEYPSVIYPTHFDAAYYMAKEIPSIWIDLDMLPFGRIGCEGEPCSDHGPGCARQTRYTSDEERSIITLWSVVQSPLIFGGDIRIIDDTTLSIVTNPSVLKAQDDITSQLQVWNKTDSIVWQGNSRSGGVLRYVAIFNVASTSIQVTLQWSDIGLTGSTYQVQDLWAQTNLGQQKSIVANVVSHGPAFYAIS